MQDDPRGEESQNPRFRLRRRTRTETAVILRHRFEPTDNARLAHLAGALDEHLRAIEAALGVRISRRDAAFRVEGRRDAAARALGLLRGLYEGAAEPIAAEAVQLALVEARSTLPPEAADPAPADAPIVLHTRRSDLRARH